VLSIEDLDAPKWLEDDDLGHTLSHALREVQRRRPLLPLPFIEKILKSTRYNIATRGVAALEVRDDEPALQHLVDAHRSISDWHLRDAMANTIESMATKQGL